jgi:hypothetical protein
VEAAHDLQTPVGGGAEVVGPSLRQPPARRCDPHEHGGRRVLERLLNAAHYGRVAAQVGHYIERGLPG